MTTDSLNMLRHQLTTARELASGGGAAFSKLKESGGAVSDMLGDLSEDVYAASGNEDANTRDAGKSLSKGLGGVAGRQAQVQADLQAARGVEAPLKQALQAALSAAGSLGLPDVDTWFVRNAIDSAQREQGYTSTSATEIARGLESGESELDAARSSAGAIARAQKDESVSSEGDRLGHSVNKLDDVFQEVGLAAGHGADQHGQVAYYIDQALSAVDDIEREHASPALVAPVPVPTFEPTVPVDPSAGTMSSPVSSSPVPVEQPQAPDGFFLKSWQG